MSERDVEVDRLRREVERAASTVRLAIACAVGAAVASAAMFVVAVPEFMRPQWLVGNELVVGLWAAFFLFGTVGAWVAVSMVRRRTTVLP